MLQAVDRTPNGKKIAADKAGVAVTDHGFINVDIQMRTKVPYIFAIGDIVGQPQRAAFTDPMKKGLFPWTESGRAIATASTSVSPSCCMTIARKHMVTARFSAAAWRRRLRMAVARMCRRCARSLGGRRISADPILRVGRPNLAG